MMRRMGHMGRVGLMAVLVAGLWSPVSGLCRDYPVTVTHVVDGDTVDLVVDLGLGVSRAERVRLAGVYAAERHEPDGPEATARLLIATECGAKLILQTDNDKRDKYGRLIGVLLCGARNLNEELMADRAPQGKGTEK